MENIFNRRVDDFLNNEVKDFARYVIESRACPSIYDGLRVGARKVLYAALTGELKKKEKVKLLTLTGDTLKLQYHHGDVSLHNTIVQLCSDHVFRYKPLQVIGQIGFIRQTKCDTAPRYLTVKKSEYINIFNTDSELWHIQEDEGEKIEPKFFYPIVPTILMYRTNSPGFGFSYRCFSYTLNSIIDNVVKVLLTGTCTDESITLVPDVVGIKNENFVRNYSKEIWYSVGEYEVSYETDTVTITDLPFNIQFEQYEEYLLSLQEKNLIKGFTNLSNGDNIKYIVQFHFGGLKRLYETSKWTFFNMFKLWSKVPKDTLNVIDENNNIVCFKTPYQLIDKFVSNRLKIYNERKTRTIKILENDIAEMKEFIKFINLVVDDKIVINKRPLQDIKKDMDKYGLNVSLLKTNIDKLTKDEIDKLNNKISETEKYLDYIKNTPVNTIYLEELITLKEKYSQIKTVE